MKLMQDGFEYISAGTVTAILTGVGGWEQGFGQRAAGRFGGSTYCLQLLTITTNPETTVNAPMFNLGSNYSRLIVGFSYMVSTGNKGAVSNIGRLFSFKDGGANATTDIQIGVGVDWSTNEFVVYRGTTEIGRSDPNKHADGVWHRLEIDATFHGSAGAVTVRLNNTDIITLTGIDTTQTANNYASRIRFGSLWSTTTGTNLYIDDVVVMDDTGSKLNGFIGEVRIDRIPPTSDIQKEWTPSTGSDHYALVDEEGINTADYVENAAGGATDIFGLADLPVTNEVLGVTLRHRAVRTGTNSYNVKLATQVGSSGTVEEVSDNLVSTVVQPFTTHVDVNPETGDDWTPSDINDLRLHLTSVLN